MRVLKEQRPLSVRPIVNVILIDMRVARLFRGSKRSLRASKYTLGRD